MPSNGSPGRANEEFWLEFLTQGHRRERVGRRFFVRIPHGPICAAPFAGMGAPLEVVSLKVGRATEPIPTIGAGGRRDG